MRISARWILPIAHPPIRGGVVAIENGRISKVRPLEDGEQVDCETLGDVVVIPGLINAHTHLELSYLQGQMDASKDLVDWLLKIVAQQQNAEASVLEQTVTAAIQSSVASSLDYGVTTIGDVSRFSHLTRVLLATGPLRVVSFGEVAGIGQRRHLIEDRLRVAGDRKHDSDFLTSALSPHAPYSIEAEGARVVCEFAKARNMRLCVHLAESVEEAQFLQTAQGRFREMLEVLGIWDENIRACSLTPVQWAQQASLLGPDCLVAHGNYVNDEDIDLLCATGTSVAYCPRTHTYFSHNNYPLDKLMGAGVNVCVGTDSLGSSPNLSVLEELSHLHRRHPEISPDAILPLGTLNGARALGLAHETGTLEVGKRADIAVFEVAPHLLDQPARALLEATSQLTRLYINGKRFR